MPTEMSMPKRVSLEEAKNGYIVSGDNEKGMREQMVCKDMDEAMSAMMKMMGSKMTGKDKMEKMPKKEYRNTSNGKMRAK
jgi:hypothetical protein